MDEFMNLNCIKQTKYIKKSDFYKQIYNSDKIRVCHDFRQITVDYPRTNGISHFNTIDELIENISQTDSKMYNVLNMIPQQVNLPILQNSLKKFKNKIFSAKKISFHIDNEKVTRTLNATLLSVSKDGFIIKSNKNITLFAKIISYHNRNYIKLEYIYYITF
jgi:hypothetical protein